MKTVKGPAIFLAQFVDQKAPFNTLDGANGQQIWGIKEFKFQLGRLF